jgi:hypothetical protein
MLATGSGSGSHGSTARGVISPQAYQRGACLVVIAGVSALSLSSRDSRVQAIESLESRAPSSRVAVRCKRQVVIAGMSALLLVNRSQA